MRFKSPITYHSKDITNVKVFTHVKGQGQDVKNFGTYRKVLSREIHMSLSLTILKIWPMLKFLQTEGQAKNYIYPIFRYGGIKIKQTKGDRVHFYLDNTRCTDLKGREWENVIRRSMFPG
jgi:hypothetical protein